MTAQRRGAISGDRRADAFDGLGADAAPTAVSTEQHHAARARLTDALVRTGTEDAGAFREVYELTSAKLYGICLHVCGERRAAEDVLHEVYLTIWRRAGAWNPALGTAITWLSAIARNRSIDWRRRQGVRRASPIEQASDVADPAPSAETVLLAADMGRRVRAILDSLDPDQREPIRDAFLFGASYPELAARYGIPLPTIKSRVRRGLALMKRQLEALA